MFQVDWTSELHKKFVQAVEQLGVDQAIPSRILELMNVKGLTRHNVASHLQVSVKVFLDLAYFLLELNIIFFCYYSSRNIDYNVDIFCLKKAGENGLKLDIQHQETTIHLRRPLWHTLHIILTTPFQLTMSILLGHLHPITLIQLRCGPHRIIQRGSLRKTGCGILTQG